MQVALLGYRVSLVREDGKEAAGGARGLWPGGSKGCRVFSEPPGSPRGWSLVPKGEGNTLGSI